MSAFLDDLISQTQALSADMRAEREPLIVDLSSYNTGLDFAAAVADGLTGVIIKSTQGTGYVSPLYADQRARALTAGLLVASYHFIDHSNVAAQVAHFLNIAGKGGLLAVDVERNPPEFGETATLADTEQFVGLVYEQTNRYPLLYSSASFLNQWTISAGSPLLKAPLWIASYRTAPLMPSQWTAWKLWQWTDHLAVKGLGNVDASWFNGTMSELAFFWRTL